MTVNDQDPYSVEAMDSDPEETSEWAESLDALVADKGHQRAREIIDGRAVTYDVNTNTNYNAVVEATAPASGPRAIARFLGREFASLYATV